MYDLMFNRTRRVLIVTCVGFWSDDVQRAFGVALLAALASHGRGDPLDLLFDLTRQPPQAAPVLERQQALALTFAEHGVRRIAVVVTSMLLTNQVRRVERAIVNGSESPAVSARYFGDRRAAEEWLASPTAA